MGYDFFIKIYRNYFGKNCYNLDMAHKKTLPVLVWKEGSLFVAKIVGIELASQGKTKKEAVKNLEEALDLYLQF
jgi:hypothetical protein